jgi:hypothetical protein
MRSLTRGPSETAPAVDESAGRISGGGVAAHHNSDVTALLEVRIEDRFCRPRTGPAGVPWRIQGFPQIHLMICYSKRLKNNKEKVRPQFLSLRQHCPYGQSLRLRISPEKPRNPAVFRGWPCTLAASWVSASANSTTPEGSGPDTCLYERRQPDPRGTSRIDRRPLQGAPKRRSRAQWESRVRCELLHTGRPPRSDILALNRAIWGISVKLRIREGERQCLDW